MERPPEEGMERAGFDDRALDRFLEKIDMSGTCWTWTGGHNGIGYGQFHLGSRRGKRTHYAHRLAFLLWVDAIPDGMTLDHACDRGAQGCVTPDHLRLMTNRANTMRSSSPPAKNARKTHCSKGHALEGDNVYDAGNGRRACQICRAASRESSPSRDPEHLRFLGRRRYWETHGRRGPEPVDGPSPTALGLRRPEAGPQRQARAPR